MELQIIPVVRKSALTLAAVKSDAVPICRLAEVAQSGQETHVDGCADVTRQYDGASGRLCSPCIGTTAPYARGRVVRPLLQSSFFYSCVPDHDREGVNPLRHVSCQTASLACRQLHSRRSRRRGKPPQPDGVNTRIFEYGISNSCTNSSSTADAAAVHSS